jgi:hypothetical protein
MEVARSSRLGSALAPLRPGDDAGFSDHQLWFERKNSDEHSRRAGGIAFTTLPFTQRAKRSACDLGEFFLRQTRFQSYRRNECTVDLDAMRAGAGLACPLA